jgi:hypothetical protein
VKVLNYLDITHDTRLGRFNEVIDWVIALDAFDYGDIKPLSDIRAPLLIHNRQRGPL